MIYIFRLLLIDGAHRKGNNKHRGHRHISFFFLFFYRVHFITVKERNDGGGGYWRIINVVGGTATFEGRARTSAGGNVPIKNSFYVTSELCI